MKRLPSIWAATALLPLALACHKDGLLSLPSSATAPALVAFGDVQVGDHKSVNLTVTNISSVAIDITGVQVVSPFSTPSGPQTIDVSQIGTLQLIFAPTVAGAFDQTLTISLSSLDTPTITVQLTGTGVAAGSNGCGATSCGSGQTCCMDACVDTQTDAAHCGGCSPCAAGDTCTAGVCVPPAATGCDDLTAPCGGTQKCCNHACVDVGSSGLCPCTGNGGNTTFGAGTIIIPMDACWQRGIDVATTPNYCSAGNAKTTADDSPLKAYGLVFFLLRHQVTVYMAINPAKNKVDAIDMTLTSFSGSAPVKRYDWAHSTEVPLANDTEYEVDYRGAPFLIDSSQHDRVMQLLATDPDFAQFRTAGNITVHVAKEHFESAIAKSISAVPSRVALLVPAGDTGSGSSSTTQILVNYLASAGLNFSGAGGTPSAPGQIYDKLQESDFLPDYAHSNLKARGYKLLWSPHWDGGTSNTAAQLATIGSYVAAGGDLFAECAAIGTLEGLSGGGFGGSTQPGSAATRFMTNAGMAGNTLNTSRTRGNTGPFTYSGLTSPFGQRGDFPFAGFSGAIADFHPDLDANSGYYSEVVRYISENDLTGHESDLLTSVDLHSQGKGTVVYLSGHDYSYGGRDAGQVGITAGSRLVLNTLFSLGTNDVCQP